MSLQFDPKTHTYTWAGQMVPSVTQILRPLSDYSSVPADVLAAAASRGTRVHEACEYIDEGGALGACEADIAPYLRAYLAWKQEVQPVTLLSEQQVYHGLHRYAGTFDRLVAIDDDEWLLDIKTGDKVMGAVGPQTAAYEVALNYGKPLRRAFLQLKADGTYRFRELTSPRDWPVFLSCLLINRFKQENAHV